MVQFLVAWFFGALGGGAPQCIPRQAPRAPRPALPCWSASRPDAPLSELPPCLGLPQHCNQSAPERPLLLAVDQEPAKVRVLGFPKYEPIASARSRSGSVRSGSHSRSK